MAGGIPWYDSVDERVWVESCVLVTIIFIAWLVQQVHSSVHARVHSDRMHKLFERCNAEFMVLGFMAFVVWVLNQCGLFDFLTARFRHSAGWLLHITEDVHMRLFIAMVFYMALMRRVLARTTYTLRLHQLYEARCRTPASQLVPLPGRAAAAGEADYGAMRSYFLRHALKETSISRLAKADDFSLFAFWERKFEELMEELIEVKPTTWGIVGFIYACYAVTALFGGLEDWIYLYEWGVMGALVFVMSATTFFVKRSRWRALATSRKQMLVEGPVPRTSLKWAGTSFGAGAAATFAGGNFDGIDSGNDDADANADADADAADSGGSASLKQKKQKRPGLTVDLGQTSFKLAKAAGGALAGAAGGITRELGQVIHSQVKEIEIKVLQWVQGFLFTGSYLIATMITTKETYTWSGGPSIQMGSLIGAVLISLALLRQFPVWLWQFNVVTSVPPLLGVRDNLIIHDMVLAQLEREKVREQLEREIAAAERRVTEVMHNMPSNGAPPSSASRQGGLPPISGPLAAGPVEL
jgi:hypothetical protein